MCPNGVPSCAATCSGGPALRESSATRSSLTGGVGFGNRRRGDECKRERYDAPAPCTTRARHGRNLAQHEGTGARQPLLLGDESRPAVSNRSLLSHSAFELRGEEIPWRPPCTRPSWPPLHRMRTPHVKHPHYLRFQGISAPLRGDCIALRRDSAARPDVSWQRGVLRRPRKLHGH